MLTEQGRVLAVDEDGLWVETHKQSACAKCSAQKGCGQSLLAKSTMPNMTCVKALFDGPSPRIWKIGDSVVIGVNEMTFLKATLISYLLPLLLMVLGALLGNQLGTHDVYSVFGAVIGLVFGFWAVRLHANHIQTKRDYNAFVVE